MVHVRGNGKIFERTWRVNSVCIQVECYQKLIWGKHIGSRINKARDKDGALTKKLEETVWWELSSLYPA